MKKKMSFSFEHGMSYDSQLQAIHESGSTAYPKFVFSVLTASALYYLFLYFTIGLVPRLVILAIAIIITILMVPLNHPDQKGSPLFVIIMLETMLCLIHLLFSPIAGWQSPVNEPIQYHDNGETQQDDQISASDRLVSMADIANQFYEVTENAIISSKNDTYNRTAEEINETGLSYYGRDTWNSIKANTSIMDIGSKNEFTISVSMKNMLVRRLIIEDEGALDIVFNYEVRDIQKDTDDWRISIVSGTNVIYEYIINRSSLPATSIYSFERGEYIIVIQRLSGNVKQWKITLDTSFHVQ